MKKRVGKSEKRLYPLGEWEREGDRGREGQRTECGMFIRLKRFFPSGKTICRNGPTSAYRKWKKQVRGGKKKR